MTLSRLRLLDIGAIWLGAAESLASLRVAAKGAYEWSSTRVPLHRRKTWSTLGAWTKKTFHLYSFGWPCVPFFAAPVWSRFTMPLPGSYCGLASLPDDLYCTPTLAKSCGQGYPASQGGATVSEVIGG